MRRPARSILLLAAALTSVRAAAQSVSAPAPRPAATAGPSATVVVTGRRLPAAKAVEHLAHAITPTGDATQTLARFPDAICPVAEGMPAEYDARLAARIRADAAAAGIPVSPPGCRPNIVVMLVPGGQAIVRELRRSRGWMFGGMEKAQVDRMVADPGPVHGWTATELRSRDADRLHIGTMLRDVPEMQVRDASIIGTTTRQVITASVLLIDVDAAIGKTVNQLADYAAMRTLALTRPAGATGDTILALFDPRAAGAGAATGAAAPRGLTGFDAGYLRALYHGPATQPAMTKVRDIARSINAAPAARPAPR